MLTCAYCGEEDCPDRIENETWQQWQCRCCRSWNERGEDFMQPVADPHRVTSGLLPSL